MPVKRMISGKQVWRGRVTLPDGKRKEKTFPTKKEALRWEMDTRKGMQDMSRQGMGCGEWLEKRFENYVSRGSGSVEEKALTFKRFFMDVSPLLPVTKLSKEIVLKHIDKIAREISPDRANRTRKHLSEAWKWGARLLDFPGKNPFDEIDDYITGSKKDLLVPELENFLKLVESSTFHDQCLLRTYYYTAARAGELVEFYWSDVNLRDGALQLTTCKGRSGQTRKAWLKVPDDLVSDLRKLRMMSAFSQDDDRVFCDQIDGGRIKDYDHWMERRCRDAGIHRFGFKGIRHLVAVTLYRSGHPVAEIQRRLRHESPTTTERYLRSLGLEIGASEVIETLSDLEKGDLKGDKRKRAL